MSHCVRTQNPRDCLPPLGAGQDASSYENRAVQNLHGLMIHYRACDVKKLNALFSGFGHTFWTYCISRARGHNIVCPRITLLSLVHPPHGRWRLSCISSPYKPRRLSCLIRYGIRSVPELHPAGLAELRPFLCHGSAACGTIARERRRLLLCHAESRGGRERERDELVVHLLCLFLGK